MAKRARNGLWKAVAAGAALLVCTTGYVALGAFRHEPKVMKGWTLAGAPIEGLGAAKLDQQVTAWWEQGKSKEVSVKFDGLEKSLTASADELGLELDLAATVARVQFDDFWCQTLVRVGAKKTGGEDVRPVLKTTAKTEKVLAEFVLANRPVYKRATATLVGDKIVTTPEEGSLAFDNEGSTVAIVEAYFSGKPAQVATKRGGAKVTEADLQNIKEVVSTFTTKYNEGKANRSANIKNAARLINGTVLLPGEEFDFNEFLGPRTIANGFKVAGEYRSGRHFDAVGGGICQVSTTLFNSVILAGLKVKERSPHSLAIPYVPLGRDAAVSFPKPDFVFVNDSSSPIALAAKTGPGWITFSILGTKSEGHRVEVSQKHMGSWGLGVKFVDDSSLPPGAQRVEDSGGPGHRAMTTVKVYRGAELLREETFESIYRGGPRIVRINRAAPKPKAQPKDLAPAEPAPPTVPADTVPPIEDGGL